MTLAAALTGTWRSWSATIPLSVLTDTIQAFPTFIEVFEVTLRHRATGAT